MELLLIVENWEKNNQPMYIYFLLFKFEPSKLYLLKKIEINKEKEK